jgi:hypothetical protein
VADFVNGRVIFPASVGTAAVISGSYAVKELNVYDVNQSQERLIFTNKYYLNSRFKRPITAIPPPYEIVTPCVFVSNIRDSNEPWALGGLYSSNGVYTLSILAETPAQLEGVVQLMVDAQDLCYPELPRSAWPLNESGFWKGGTGYNWETQKATYGTSGRFEIRGVQGTKLTDNLQLDPNLWVGVVDMQVSKVRTIH